jgi:hypothetical protein
VAILTQNIPDGGGIGFSSPEIASMMGNYGIGAGGGSAPQERFSEWRTYWQDLRQGPPPSGALTTNESLQAAHPLLQQAPDGSVGIVGTNNPPPSGGMTIRSPRGIIQLPEEDVRDVQGNAASKLKLSELRDLVRRIKGIDDPQPSDMYALWEAAIGQMELAEDMGMEPHDPWYWLQQQAEAADADAERRRQAEQAVSETIQRTISLTDPDTAGVVIRSVMRRLLRRDPKDAEVAEFLDALNAKERGAPQVTTTTSTPAPDVSR